MTTQEGQPQESAAMGAAGAEVMASVEWGGFVISHIEKDLNMVEAGQQDEQESEEPAEGPDVEPPPLAYDDEDKEGHWTDGMKAHTKEKQDDEDEGTRKKSKRAQKRSRQKERKRIVKMGCGCSGTAAGARNHEGCCVEVPPGLPAKGPEQSSARGSGGSSGSSQDHERTKKEQEGEDKIKQWKKDMTWKTE